MNAAQLNSLESGAPITWKHPRTGEPHKCVFSDVRFGRVCFWFEGDTQTEDDLCALSMKEARTQLQVVEG